MQTYNLTNNKTIRQQNFKCNFYNANNFNKSTSTDSQTNTSQKKKDLTFLKKLYYYPSLRDIPAILPVSYGLYHLVKLHTLKKRSKKNLILKDKINDFKKLSSKNLLICCGLTVPIYLLTDYLNKINENKRFTKAQKQVDYFNCHNGTNIKLVKTVATNKKATAGEFNPMLAQIRLNERIPGDVINSKVMQTYIINHELIHAKQNILMACSKNGISKLNYLYVKNAAKDFDNEEGKAFIQKSYNACVKEKNTADLNVEYNGVFINAKDLYTALYKVLIDKETEASNIPIIINKSFYEQAKSARGPLTKEEEKKAQAYFEAYEHYDPIKKDAKVNPNKDSGYKQNLLEIDASKAPFLKFYV